MVDTLNFQKKPSFQKNISTSNSLLEISLQCLLKDIYIFFRYMIFTLIADSPFPQSRGVPAKYGGKEKSDGSEFACTTVMGCASSQGTGCKGSGASDPIVGKRTPLNCSYPHRTRYLGKGLVIYKGTNEWTHGA